MSGCKVCLEQMNQQKRFVEKQDEAKRLHRFLDGMIWFTYLSGQQGWFFKKRVGVDCSKWSQGALLMMRRNIL